MHRPGAAASRGLRGLRGIWGACCVVLVAGGGWWLAPLLVLGAVPAAAWSLPAPGDGLALAALLSAGALGIVACELWFRGRVHGLLVLDFRVQRPRGDCRLSRL